MSCGGNKGDSMRVGNDLFDPLKITRDRSDGHDVVDDGRFFGIELCKGFEPLAVDGIWLFGG